MDNDFERELIKYVTRWYKDAGMTHSDFARKFFYDLSEEIAVRQWRRVRDPKKSGNIRKLTLTESRRFSDIMGMKFSNLIWQIEQIIENKEVG
ncbi:hypothetical protein [Maridesulfovibrio sp.]|uniref:hypothetical protein n=1 Tax=Maridesulfovibrio sp. TaxID=2795000 RepID=UPI0029CA7141|nr:hypothetical protein [Maridesulfovibrio sp.]